MDKIVGRGGNGGFMRFGLLMWKNATLQKRHKVQTAFEVILPLLFTIILVLIRALITSKEFSEPVYFPEYNPGDYNRTYVLRGEYVLYAPNNPEVTRIMNLTFENYFKDFGEWEEFRNGTVYEFVGFRDAEALLRAYDEDPRFGVREGRIYLNENPVLGAVVFTNEQGANELKYQIRFPATHHGSSSRSSGEKPRWYTELLYSVFDVPGPRQSTENKTDEDSDERWERIFKEHGGIPGYWRQGFLYLQHAVEHSIAFMKTDDPSKLQEFEVALNRFPYPPYIDDLFVIALQSFLPLILVLSYIYPIVNISKSIVHEKERRLKESMKMMGLPNWLHWAAWFTKSFIFLVVSTILMTIIMKIKFYGDGLSVLTFSDGSLLFVFFLTYLFSVITLGFLVSSLFSTANSASTASGVLFFLTYFPYIFLQPRYSELSKGTKLGMSIFSNTGMAFGCQIITMFEGTGAGIKWSTVAEGASPDDNLSMLDVMIMLVVDGFLYLFLAIYLEGIRPGDYGVPLPWYFPFTKWYWFGEARVASDNMMGSATTAHHNKNAHLFEKEPNSRAGIRIMGLKKVFDKKVAVDDLHLNFYENQVTALLGHNGAGKTTTMSMITGLFPPTSGTVLVNGFDIRTDMQKVRDSLGLCPQHDVLFDEMTVEEHLRFFCLLKGNDRTLVQGEIDRMLVALKLENKRHAQSQTLSGGMKRKLSVGIALVGGSQVVLLDEPTSGMDPGARRSTWDLISNEKKGRTIVLSTHFMDEADLLGDRIAIMAHGKVICCGSSLFLKKKYGGGYHLIMVKEHNCQVHLITQLLQKRMPEVEVDQNIGTELSYSLPDAKSYMFPEIFEELERRKVELGVASYGCSITQMEEVFMRVGEQVEEEKNGTSFANGHMSSQKAPNYQAINVAGDDMPYAARSTSTFKLDHSDGDSQIRNEGSGLALQQLRAMIVKKCLYAIRNKLLLISQVVVPVAFLIIALVMIATLPELETPEERPLDLNKYTQMGRPVTTMECQPREFSDICKTYEQVASIGSDVETTNMFEHYIIDQSEDNLPRTNFKYMVGLKATLNDNDTKTKLKGFFNNQPYHTSPVALNFVSNSILRNVTGNDNLKLTVSNWPLPFTQRDKIDKLGDATQSEGFQVGFNVAFGMSFLAASFVVFLIKEREAKSKHLQYVSGVKFPVFWLAHWLFDTVNYLIPCFALMIVLAAFQTDDFKGAKMQGLFLLVLLLYGWSVIPLMYLFSFLFTVPSSGYTRMTFFNILTGTATILAITILSIPDLDLMHIADALEWIFMFFPNFNVGYAVTQLAINKNFLELCPDFLVLVPGACDLDPDFECCTKYPIDYLSWKKPGIGRNLFFSFLIGAISWGILYIIESKIIEKIRYRNEGKKVSSDSSERDPMVLEDSDVVAENDRVRQGTLEQMFQSDNMILRDLTKYYGKFLAVDRLCLGVKHGECFGLLGVNGAGKTTTFKMLTGDIPITTGDAYVTDKSVKSHIKDVQRVIGYCPQFDALIPELTGRETIRLFARLRGVHESEIDGLVDRLAADLLFTEHIEKACGTYSGGNKRKLSTALSLIGNPPIVFLDEPTTGMDPVARRHLWNTIIKVRAGGTSVILTSHSMEECEALCTRLAIMVNGKFRCLGSTQHLKNKFGDGYTLIAQMESNTEIEERKRTRTSLELGRRRSSMIGKVEKWEQDLQPLRNFIERNFPGCQLKDIHPAYVHYHIPEDGAVTWGQMFKKMEEAKALFRLEAYSVGQTSLEQVFLGFAKGQCNDEDE